MAASRSSSPRFDDAGISTGRRLGKVRVSCDVMASNHCLAFATEVRWRHLAAFNAGRRVGAKASLKPFYDPKSERVKA